MLAALALATPAAQAQDYPARPVELLVPYAVGGGVAYEPAGDHPLLIRGTNANNPVPGDLDPRTALGYSQDRRYL